MWKGTAKSRAGGHKPALWNLPPFHPHQTPGATFIEILGVEIGFLPPHNVALGGALEFARAKLRNWKLESPEQRSGICWWAFSCTHIRRRSKVAERMNWLTSTSSGEHLANQPAILETGIWNLGCGRMNWIVCMGYPARIMALSSWRMEILFPDSRFHQSAGLAKMTLFEYPCFQTSSPKALGEVCRWKLETGNWKLSGTSWQR